MALSFLGRGGGWYPLEKKMWSGAIVDKTMSSQRRSGELLVVSPRISFFDAKIRMTSDRTSSFGGGTGHGATRTSSNLGQ